MRPGATVSHYRLLERLGVGGMGVVFKAEDTHLGRQVALKFLPAGVDDEENVRRFEAEARSLSAINHPGICTIYEIGSHQGRPFLAMELLEGESLHHLVARREISPPVAIDIGIQVADALEAAHHAGIVHRDVKPANIFLTRRGLPKVLDFGLAKPMAAGADARRLTQTGMTMGTVAYMSPEQARGLPLDGRSDVFSLGLVLYEMVTGQATFAGQTAAVIFDELLNRDPVALGRLAPSIPAELERIVHRAMAKDLAARYQSAAALRDDLRRLQGDLESGRAVPTAAEARYAPASRAVPAERQPAAGGSQAAPVQGRTREDLMAAAGLAGPAPGTAGRARRLLNAASLLLALALTVALALSWWQPWRSGEKVTTAAGNGPAGSQAPGTTARPSPTPAGPGPATDGDRAPASTTTRGAQATAPGAPAADPPPTAPTAPAPGPGESAAEAEADRDFAVARAKLERKLVDQGVADLDALRQRFPRSRLVPEAAFLAADAERAAGRAGQAMGRYVEFGTRYPAHPRAPEALYRLAQLTLASARRGAPEDARGLFGEVADRYAASPWAPRALAERAVIEERLKLREIDQALATSVPSALVTLRRLTDRYPKHPLAEDGLWTLAGLFERINRFEHAAGALERLGASFPSTRHDAWFRAGEICERRLKDRARARAAYERVPPSSRKYDDARKKLK